LRLAFRGGHIFAVARHESGKANDFKQAFQMGHQKFWHLLGLNLFYTALIIIPLVVIGLLGITLLGSEDASWNVIVLSGSLLLWLPIAAVILLIGELAQRELILNKTGIIASFLKTWNMILKQLGKTLVIWIIHFILSIGISIIYVIGMISTLTILGIMALMLVHIPGVGLLIMIALVGSVVLVALVVIGILNSFLSAYWTLAYLRLKK
jgi:hypothetical protein